MNKIVLYCKSYIGDLGRVQILLDSIVRYNVNKIPFYISCPRADMAEFKKYLGDAYYTLIDDESIYEDVQGNGWNSQQIVKSSFWKLELCENYLILDSDSYFIKHFYVSDFIAPDGEPYTVMHEQKELFGWSCNKERELGFDPIKSFKECRKPIMDIFGRASGRYYDFGPSPVIWSCDVWRSLDNDYMKPNKLRFSDLIRMVPSEFSWYGEYLLAMNRKIYPIEPLFKVFHYKKQYIDHKEMMGYTESEISKVYMGIIMQSNAGIPSKY